MFSADLAICKDEISAPENGEVECSDGQNLGSVCAFYCDPGFALLGEEASTCVSEGIGNTASWKWDNPIPRCQGNVEFVFTSTSQITKAQQFH